MRSATTAIIASGNRSAFQVNKVELDDAGEAEAAGVLEDSPGGGAGLEESSGGGAGVVASFGALFGLSSGFGAFGAIDKSGATALEYAEQNSQAMAVVSMVTGVDSVHASNSPPFKYGI
mmetsp:Transcript_15205/g.18333  ORF Transcript_15205/g.18333 Transcript_15205/m.18333 type:complete len:119 (+) Transcript_15205:301-657(+)